MGEEGTGGATTIAQSLGRYIAHADLTTVPPHARQKTKLCLLDSIGCMVGGTRLDVGQTVTLMVQEWGGRGGATLVGQAIQGPAPWAAYVNAYLANLLDYDDTTPLGHPGSTIVPTALALAECLHCPGEELLLALLVGYEVALRVAGATSPSPERERQIRGMGTWQIFGAAAAAARLMGLDASQAAHALALAVNHAPVPCTKKFGHRERPISWIKNNLGWTGLGGILAAQLATRGMASNLTNFDGPNGFWIMAGADEPRFGAYTEGLGQVYHVLDVSFKPYPACRGLHTTLDAVGALVQRHQIEARQVHRVTVTGALKLLDYSDPAPKTIPDAQFSIPYLTALLLRRQAPGYGWFSGENMKSAEVAALARRVQFQHDEHADARYNYREQTIISRVRIEMADGRWWEETVETPRGDPLRPLTAHEMEEKFLDLVVPVLGASQARKLLGLVEALEQLDDTARLAEYYGKAG